jgi:hypothetical protein
MIQYIHFFKEVARGGERTRVLLISFIFSFFHHFTAEPQRLPNPVHTYNTSLCTYHTNDVKNNKTINVNNLKVTNHMNRKKSFIVRRAMYVPSKDATVVNYVQTVIKLLVV